MKPKDCVHTNCNNIIYVPDSALHLCLMCEKCIDVKNNIIYETN